WDELQHVLIAGTLGGGATTVLASTVSAIAGRFRPDALRLWTIGSPRLLPPELLALPHQIATPVDPTDDARMEEVVQTVRAELVRRMRRTEPSAGAEGPQGDGSDPLARAPWPDIVLVIPELAHGQGAGTVGIAGDPGGNSGHGGHGALLELLHTVAVDGPAHGIRLLGATSHAEALDPEVIALFPTRLVLQQPDAAPSVRLLGRPDAAVLQGGGHLLLSIDGRAPVELRGFRLSHERLVDLVRLLNTRFGATGVQTLDQPLASSPPFVHRDPAAEPVVEGHPTGVPAAEEPAAEEPAAGEPLGDPASPARPEAQIEPESFVEPAVPAGLEAPRETEALTESEAPGGLAVGSEDARPGASAGGDAAPRLEIHCFGGFEVSWGERRLSATGQAGPRHRSWEILAFLAAQPAEVVSTEKLLNAIWPDSDAEKAASALGAALSRLRGVLADQVPGLTGPLVSRDRIGRTCHLDSAVISSDVHQFVRLCREARRLPSGQAIEAYQTARRLYAGDLLKDASYVWLHERDDDGLTLPERYRETYRLITNELAGLYVQGGQTGEAVSLYRELLRAEPTLEDVARRLYRCFGRLGDRVSLVREHHRLQQALQEVYGGPDALDDDPALATPEPETIAVFEEVLAALDARGSTGRNPEGPGRGAEEDEEEGCAA
ncbi:MAG: winged helix-turn-helix domain-containing protein, partial [Chloroflexota bacterium]|nr:winged helix-turn-helix domain-containing protein [Chloroflexota bacterium]